MKFIKKNKIKILAAFLLLLMIVIIVVFIQLQPSKPESNKLESALQDEAVEITNIDNLIIIKNIEENSKNGLIFYPGGLVQPEAYVYNMVQISKALDLQIFIVRFPLDLAVFDINAADKVRNKYSDIENWYIGGHSLGGAMGCRNLESNMSEYSGLLILASYCDIDIGDFYGNVISIKGDNDNVIKLDNYEKGKAYLPEGSIIVDIEGINHSQFGSYGPQKGDNEDMISDDQALLKITDELKKHL